MLCLMAGDNPQNYAAVGCSLLLVMQIEQASTLTSLGAEFDSSVCGQDARRLGASRAWTSDIVFI
jgi:hypothetical protein